MRDKETVGVSGENGFLGQMDRLWRGRRGLLKTQDGNAGGFSQLGAIAYRTCKCFNGSLSIIQAPRLLLAPFCRLTAVTPPPRGCR